jgi:thymidylate synthase (FAD)
MKQINIPSHGYVKWLGVAGDQYRILKAARLSTGGVEQKGEKQDYGLLRYLYKNEHLSPFEKVQLEFELKIPHSIAKQLLRHRTAKPNEYSLRYSEAIADMYMPEQWRKQGEKNHQGSEGPIEEQDEVEDLVGETYDMCWGTYQTLINEYGVSREQARFVLPLANYTLIDITMDLRNFFHFLELRLHPHAQEEIRDVAKAMHTLAWQHEGLQWAMKIFDEFNELKYLYHEAINNVSDTTKLKEHLQQFISQQ